MSDLVSTLTNVFSLTFVVTSMFSFGLRLTLQQIIEPLRDVPLVIKALLVNFVILPAAALLLAGILGLDNDLMVGLILISTVAGAALVPKLAQIAKGNLPFAVALVALLVVTTVFFLPLVLPLLLPGVQVDAWGIATSLALQILLPLVLGLIVDYISKDEADALLPVLGQISNVSLALLLALQLGSNLGDVIDLLGTGSILATILLLAAAMVAGYFLGGPDPATRRTLSLASGQRNIAAAFVVATANFADRPGVLVFLAAAGLIAMVLVMPVAGLFGRQAESAAEPQGAAASAVVPVTGGKSKNREEEPPGD